MFEFKINTNKKYEIIDITDKIKEIVKLSKIKKGIVVIFVPHTTAALIINENADENVNKDILNCLSKLIPEGIWLHDKIDNNAAAHIKSSIVGCSKVIPFKDGKLLLGTWQSISLVELDDPRERKIIVEIK